MTDRAQAAIDAFRTGLDHAMIALGYLAGLAFVIGTVACVLICTAVLLSTPARRARWRIDAWRHRP